MKFGKVLSWFVVMVLGVFLLSACAPVASAYVQIDPALRDWIMIGTTVLVGFLLAKANEIDFIRRILEYFKVDQYKLTISAWLAGVVVEWLQVYVLDRIPVTWDNVAVIVMRLIVAVIVTLYGFAYLARRGVSGFRQ